MAQGSIGPSGRAAAAPDFGGEVRDSSRILPAHIEETVSAIAKLHAQHYREATPLQRAVDGLTARASRPEFVAYAMGAVALWIALNLAAHGLGMTPVDEPPFYWLQGAVGLGALFMTSIILATQRREDELGSYREQLTLELGILSEQKAAKIIELLEELRRDLPSVRDRVDAEAEALAVPANPEAVLEAIKETQDLAQDLSQDSARDFVPEVASQAGRDRETGAP